MVRDLSNYIYRTTGLSFQHTPEYRGKGKATTLRWFMTWDDVAPVTDNICKAMGVRKLTENWLPVAFYSLIIQDASRGVFPRTSKS